MRRLALGGDGETSLTGYGRVEVGRRWGDQTTGEMGRLFSFRVIGR